jgi:hypothetical protein
MSNTYYTPLPKCLDIAKSKIHGRGLFATEQIPSGIILGITHVEDKRFKDGLIRTELGGYFNHSDKPNCEVVTFGDIRMIKTLTILNDGDELTTKYSLYNPET